MLDFFAVPEHAICAFERWSKLHVVIYDLDETLLFPYLAPVHLRHAQPHCLAVKSTALKAKCDAFERDHLYAEIGNYPDGRVQICHAGLVEWVMPVQLESRLVLIVLAGQRLPGNNLKTFDRDPACASHNLPWEETMVLPVVVDEEESQLYLEGLRQLAARLQLWLMEAAQFIGTPLQRPNSNDLSSRRDFILRYIHMHHRKAITLSDLATKLGLSESRVAHVVKESCGKSFGTLLTEARVRSAATLLRHARLSVTEVALQCGFSDPSRFHKVFKEHTGMTPMAYRKEAREV
ncbi:MAG: helix-turn-helix domain-containing protein [Caldilineaceae bacterium]|nr:helix-turn-helix domain-containing protein [Caldilineaceae bacterium]